LNGKMNERVSVYEETLCHSFKSEDGFSFFATIIYKEAKMKRCIKSIMPETWAGITFDEKGVCNACKQAEKKPNIDWNKRQRLLVEILEK